MRFPQSQHFRFSLMSAFNHITHLRFTPPQSQHFRFSLMSYLRISHIAVLLPSIPPLRISLMSSFNLITHLRLSHISAKSIRKPDHFGFLCSLPSTISHIAVITHLRSLILCVEHLDPAAACSHDTVFTGFNRVWVRKVFVKSAAKVVAKYFSKGGLIC